METITSLQNEKVKLTHALQTRARARRKERKIVLEGVRLIRDAMQAGERPLFAFYLPDIGDYDVIAELQDKRTPVIPVNAEVMRHISDTPSPQGIVAVFPLPEPSAPRHVSRILILDTIRDPGNLGTILRTSAAAGVETVILSPGCADPYNPKTLRSGMGAHFRTPIMEADWSQIVTYCQPAPIYLATGDGEVRYDAVDWTQEWALIIGSEAHGAGNDAKRIATQRIFIPMSAETESLNAAVATGVILFEAARQRG
jgi:TrmH family RNA methyltransferase